MWVMVALGEKSEARMKEIINDGAIILFVSHSTGQILGRVNIK